ncbi:hypothetical protein DMB65_08775 [Flavobacterium cheongpyeongense]|uniref:Uncharacterized protein n=1 Tax=Flavobacterium cheongpyeongense TaxID=2212651 RepID=A0A2V4BT78_9FLAO|nr:hypothetical protein [Flavobacterium cheongpyeongense]PXY41043.1 hypothetical protein DMB65_08775 [Flavobacterium cheongpyeongense]
MNNKNRLLTLALSLTIIIFILFTKWWIADVVDGTDGIMYGFPLIYKSPAFYTSMANQYFLMALVIDFFVYFMAVFAFLFLINKFFFEIRLNKKQLLTIYAIATVLFGIEILFATVFESRFLIKRDFDIEVKQTGFKFYLSEEERKIYNKSHQ